MITRNCTQTSQQNFFFFDEVPHAELTQLLSEFIILVSILSYKDKLF